MSRILKALSSIRKSGARTLLMGGQACVFYGAAEFSRDVDLLILADAENLANVRSALDALEATVIAVPGLEERHLLNGHAVHFRCRRADVAGLRIDVMAVLRGVDLFEELWERRTTLEIDGEPVDLLAMEDLVRAKKTQQDKDWPMIRRLVEQSYFEGVGNPTPGLVQFWLCELRTPQLLAEVVAAHPEAVEAVSRAAVRAALLGSAEEIGTALEMEEQDERRKDREYWTPLKRELEELRLSRGKNERGR